MKAKNLFLFVLFGVSMRCFADSSTLNITVANKSDVNIKNAAIHCSIGKLNQYKSIEDLAPGETVVLTIPVTENMASTLNSLIELFFTLANNNTEVVSDPIYIRDIYNSSTKQIIKKILFTIKQKAGLLRNNAPFFYITSQLTD